MFATCLNCMDGRAQLPVINWIMENYDIKYVDMITEAGINGFLADEYLDISEILKKVRILKNSANFWELEKAKLFLKFPLISMNLKIYL